MSLRSGPHGLRPRVWQAGFLLTRGSAAADADWVSSDHVTVVNGAQLLFLYMLYFKMLCVLLLVVLCVL